MNKNISLKIFFSVCPEKSVSIRSTIYHGAGKVYNFLLILHLSKALTFFSATSNLCCQEPFDLSVIIGTKNGLKRLYLV